MRVWGANFDPYRDLGLIMPACSNLSVVNTLRSSLYGDGVFIKSQQATGSVADLAQDSCWSAKNPQIRVCGAIMGPHRDLGRLSSARSTFSVMETLRLSQYGR